MPARFRQAIRTALWVMLAGFAAIVANSDLAGSRAGLSALAPAPALAQTPAVSKVIIVAAGIDPLQSNPQSCPPISSFSGCYDAYGRASSTFDPVLTLLGCAQTPPAGSPLVPCSGGIAWIPFSYAGLASGVPQPYTGAQTGQPLAQSAARMDELVQSLRARPEVGNAPIVIIAHSLGGAVSTYWGATHPNVPVLTFDSPVNGIWDNTDIDVTNVYCNGSVGLFTYIQAESCNLLFFVPAATSAAVDALRQPATVQRMGQARQLNFANTVDAFVPSWFAVSRTQTIGAVLKTSNCTYVTDPIFNHFCIIDAAASEAAAFISSGTLPPLAPIRDTITLSISASAAGTPVDGTVTAKRLGQVIAQTRTSGGKASLTVPWLDALVEFTYSGGTMKLGALPGGMTNLSLDFTRWTTPPSKSCTPANPAVGAQTVCTLTLTGSVNSGVLIHDTVASPAGSHVTGCTGSGSLVCLVRSQSSAQAQCSVFVRSCPAGTTFTVRITGGAAGPLTESVEFTPNAGSTPVLIFPVTASPPVTFGPGSGEPPAVPADMLHDLEASVAGVDPANSLVHLVRAARAQVAAGRGVAACGMLQGFITQVEFYQRFRLIPSPQAQQFTTDATAIRTALNCQ